MHAKFKVVAATFPWSRIFAAIAKSTRANVLRIMAPPRARGLEATSRGSFVDRLLFSQQFAALYMHRRFWTTVHLHGVAYSQLLHMANIMRAMALVPDVGPLVYYMESRYPLSLIGSDWFVDYILSNINLRMFWTWRMAF